MVEHGFDYPSPGTPTSPFFEKWADISSPTIGKSPTLGKRPPLLRLQRHWQPETINRRRSMFVAFLLLATATIGHALLPFTREQASVGAALVVPLVALEPASSLVHLAWTAVAAAGGAGLYLGAPDGAKGSAGRLELGLGVAVLILKSWLYGVVGAAFGERRAVGREETSKGALTLIRTHSLIAAIGACVLAFALSRGLPSFDQRLDNATLAYAVTAGASDVVLYLLLAFTGPAHAAVAHSAAACGFVYYVRLQPMQGAAPVDQAGALALLAAGVGLFYLARLTGRQAFLRADSFTQATSPGTPTSAPRRHARAASSISGLKPQWNTSPSSTNTPTLLRLSAGVIICVLYLAALNLHHTAKPVPRKPSGGRAMRMPKLVQQATLNGTVSVGLHPAGNTGAVLGRGEDFGAYLRANIPQDRVVWLTVADGNYARAAVPHLSAFLDTINAASANTSEARQELIVLCQDGECVGECAKLQVYAFGGFAFNVDDRLQPSNEHVRVSVWVKLRGILESLQAGYSHVFVDGDVFFRSDPRKHMLPLSDPTWDLQIQDEGDQHAVNIGYFFQRASAKSVALWTQVADLMLASVGPWDQRVVNELLDTLHLRVNPAGKVVDSFVSPQGLNVKVLSAKHFWGFHLGWMQWEETTLLHMTCGDSTYLKFFVAAAYGGFGNIGGYYTSPPRILIAPPLAGTTEEILDTLRLVIAAARLTNRSIILPLQSEWLGPSSRQAANGFSPLFKYSKQERLFVHRPFTWSVVPFEQVERHYGVDFLEPNYLEHAALHLSMSDPTLVHKLSSVAVFDMHPEAKSWASFAERIQSPLFDDALVVRLSTNEGPRGEWSHYRNWNYPSNLELERLRLCRHIEDPVTCFLCSGSIEDDFFLKKD